MIVFSTFLGESGIERLKSWLDTIFATTSNTSLIIVGTHLDMVRKNREPGFPERMRQLVKEAVELPKYSKGQINSVYIKEVSCALDNREGKIKKEITSDSAILQCSDWYSQSRLAAPIPNDVIRKPITDDLDVKVPL